MLFSTSLDPVEDKLVGIERETGVEHEIRFTLMNDLLVDVVATGRGNISRDVFDLSAWFDSLCLWISGEDLQLLAIWLKPVKKLVSRDRTVAASLTLLASSC